MLPHPLAGHKAQGEVSWIYFFLSLIPSELLHLRVRKRPPKCHTIISFFHSLSLVVKLELQWRRKSRKYFHLHAPSFLTCMSSIALQRWRSRCWCCCCWSAYHHKMFYVEIHFFHLLFCLLLLLFAIQVISKRQQEKK